MIFLDYHDISRTDEPTVVHIDQENGYKIITLAANFEDFICGLVNGSKFKN